jgi:GH43 family beta-xylosidase
MLADPFVVEHQGRYWAIGTAYEGFDATLGPFPAVVSDDLVHWIDAGPVRMEPLGTPWIYYWAPEVVRRDGVFYLYFSLGASHERFQLRVATGSSPLGPYTVWPEPVLDPRRHAFAIDAHPFLDDDGRWYLYYAFDHLGSDRPGTIVAVASLRNMMAVADDEVVVARARHDWQRFQKDRKIYGGVYDWHTLEGPAAVRRDGKLYCFYSGGNWQDESYGVDYVVADSPLGTYVDDNAGEGPRLLRTVPGGPLGPGHNSFVQGPDGTTLVAYHAWDQRRNKRRLCLDRLVWADDGPRCGATCRAGVHAPR